MKYSVHAERAKLEKKRNNHPPRLSELSGRSLIGTHTTATFATSQRTIRRPCWHLKPIYNSTRAIQASYPPHETIASYGTRFVVCDLRTCRLPPAPSVLMPCEMKNAPQVCCLATRLRGLFLAIMTRRQFLWYAKRVLLSFDVGITYSQVSLFQNKDKQFF